LFFGSIVADYALCEYVERSSQENFVGWRLDDMNLKVEGEVFDEERDIASEAKREVTVPVG
jgi:hypothetical protein